MNQLVKILTMYESFDRPQPLFVTHSITTKYGNEYM